jgi:hypothetical protein
MLGKQLLLPQLPILHLQEMPPKLHNYEHGGQEARGSGNTLPFATRSPVCGEYRSKVSLLEEETIYAQLVSVMV